VALPALTRGPGNAERAGRLRSPLLLALAALLGLEALGGLVIFVARLTAGTAPGETLHVVAGVGFTVLYAVYQWRHWRRVRPFRRLLDHGLGLIAALMIAFVNITGLWLGVLWWQGRHLPLDMRYPSGLAAMHNVAAMLVVSFVPAHLGAVLLRAGRAPSPRNSQES
jgi:hypothetical protein